MNTPVSRIDALSRALIGFDTLFEQMDKRFQTSVATNYPPHNIVKTRDNEYAIQMAVTGFEKAEISVTVESDVLFIKGHSETVEYSQDQYLHRGLATRDFEKEFPLAEHLEVLGAQIKNGMLTVRIIRNIPESAKAKIIDIVDIK